MTDLYFNGSIKMLRESLCIATTAIRLSFLADSRMKNHIENLQKLVNEIDLHRPLGPDGKHDNRHTNTCGCEDD